MTGSLLLIRVVRGLLVITMAAGAPACDVAVPAAGTGPTAAQGFTPGAVHPTRDNLPERGSLAAYIRSTDSRQAGSKLQEVARRLRSARLLSSVGALEGDESEVFGSVEDVAADEDGRFFILDSRYNNVRVHGAGGKPVAVFAGPGRGPGELMAPEALERDRRGRLVVADRYNVIKTFEPHGATFRSTGSIALRFVPEDFCLLGDQIYVQGVRRDGGVVHAFSLGGDSLLSFGTGYASPNWLVRNQLSDGPIACSEKAGTVVMMYKYLPVVYGYAANGQVKWVSQLADFRSMRIVEGVEPEGLPSVSFPPNPDGHDIALSLLASGDFVLVQTARHTLASLEEQREYAELRTYLLSASTGEGVYVSNRLPRFSAITNGLAYATVNDPYPQVRVYRLAEEGRAE